MVTVALIAFSITLGVVVSRLALDVVFRVASYTRSVLERSF
jgi:hypothetical protein